MTKAYRYGLFVCLVGWGCATQVEVESEVVGASTALTKSSMAECTACKGPTMVAAPGPASTSADCWWKEDPSDCEPEDLVLVASAASQASASGPVLTAGTNTSLAGGVCDKSTGCPTCGCGGLSSLSVFSFSWAVNPQLGPAPALLVSNYSTVVPSTQFAVWQLSFLFAQTPGPARTLADVDRTSARVGLSSDSLGVSPVATMNDTGDPGFDLDLNPATNPDAPKLQSNTPVDFTQCFFIRFTTDGSGGGPAPDTEDLACDPNDGTCCVRDDCTTAC